MSEPLLSLGGISKHYGAIEALSNLSIRINPGEVVGLVGDNGAGKSTLIKIIAGNFPPSSGTITFDSKNVHFARPRDAQEAGIAVVYQDLALCNNLSAAANIFLGRELCRGPFLDHSTMNREAERLFRELKSDTRPWQRVGTMSGGQRQAVAIARALKARAKLILFDEPTAAISVRQVSEVMALIKRLRDQGIAVVLVSHRMPDIFEVCEKVVVLRRGIKVADKALSATNPEEITGLITGAIDAA